jgi:hypothetical protein
MEGLRQSGGDHRIPAETALNNEELIDKAPASSSS